MKVFLSWSGSRSHKVALIFRDWLPSVIQEIVPYVSSEDIDKGARWSTDIAKELEDSTFGILCVTRENINAPWLTFEAGALSKTIDKAYVSPFLFDVKRSEIDGPILQFQSTISEKEDLKKLVTTLNKACEKDGLTEERLNKAFEVWYPTLKDELEKLKGQKAPEEDDSKNVDATVRDTNTQQILEEILELSRINQKLIRNPEGSVINHLEETRQMVRELFERQERRDSFGPMRKSRRFHPMMIEELLHMGSVEFEDGAVGIQMTLAIFRDEFPWIYESGMEALKIARSRTSRENQEKAIRSFVKVVEFTFEHPIMRERMERSKEWHIMSRELPRMLEHAFHRLSMG